MKNSKHYKSILTTWTSISFILISFLVFVVKGKRKVSSSPGSLKYPLAIMVTLRKSLGGTCTATEYDHLINRMTKIDVLGKYIEHSGKKITGSLFRDAVFQVFGLNLKLISDEGEGAKLSIYPEEIMIGLRKALNIEKSSTKYDKKIMSFKKAKVMDMFLDVYNVHTVKEMVNIVNLIYGINLPGISSLEHSRVSLYSKNQWLLQSDLDLFVVYTGKGDIDVKVYPTPLYIKQTGLKEIPVELQIALQNLGFRYHENKSAFYFFNPTGETVSDSFKGQTLRAINSAIEKINQLQNG